jgi:hypothetical protein
VDPKSPAKIFRDSKSIGSECSELLMRGSIPLHREYLGMNLFTIKLLPAIT